MQISISVKGYRSKPSNIPKIEYVRKDLEIKEIAEHISNGHAISANFTVNDSERVTQKQRTYANFINTCFVMFDLNDDEHETLEELNNSLLLKPTICYTTYSHQQANKGNRYRLLYFFYQTINSIEDYRNIYDRISFKNKLKLKDNCGRNCCQNVFGTYYSNINYSLISNENLYHIEDFTETDKSINTTYREKGGKSIIECNDTLREYTISNDSFLNDFKEMKIKDIILKYSTIYDNIEETPMSNPNEDEAYILYPQDYICIRRRWIPFEVLNEEGNVRTRTTRIRRFKDGERRKYKLYFNGIIRRLITYDYITFDNLLFNILYEFYYYYEHTEIDKQSILMIAKNVWNADLTKYEEMRGSKHQFRVNPLYCTKYGVTRKQAKQIASKQLKSQQIGELYDCTLTDKENLEEFKKHGVNISIISLKRWRKENSISKYEKKDKTVAKSEAVVIPIDSLNYSYAMAV